MHPLILTLLLIVGVREAEFWQELTCPYERQHQGLLRVWCRQSSADCCTGLTFSQSAHLLDGGKLKVTQGSDSFTVAVLEPSHGHGMHWCGVLGKNGTIIRLAEGYFHSSSGAYIWSVTRWILLPLLPMVTIFTNVYSRTTANMCKEAEFDDITVSRALTDPQNPDGDVQPWCYIADHEDGIYWRYCDIPTCQMPGNLGCFKDSGDPPTLSGTSETSNKLTIQNCISFCRKQRYKLAGMESGYACFCGNEVDLRDHGESPSMECNHVCFGDHTQPCGGDGWVIIFDTRVGACGGNYSSPSGVIYSPDFPDKYAAGRVCYWTIQVPGSSAILFNFTFFDISDQTDMVELLDGNTNQVVARFDWRSPPRELVNVTGDFVILYFYSDRTNQAQGFALLYQALRSQDTGTMDAGGDDEDEGEDVSSTAGPHLAGGVTERSNSTSNGHSSQILYVITSSPGKPEHNMPVWTIYALAALLILTVIAMVAKLLLHITVKSPNIPTVSGSDSCSQGTASSEPWIILYRPSTISLFKKKLKNHHGDLSPLVGN